MDGGRQAYIDEQIELNPEDFEFNVDDIEEFTKI